MTRQTCPVHPGIITETRPCYRCHVDTITQPIRDEVATMRTELANLEEAPMETATVDGVDAASITAAIERAAESTWKQPTLSDELFLPVKARDVPTVKVTISGTIELTRSEYESYLDGATLGPGAVVEIRASGYVVQPGAAWVKRSAKDADGERQTWHEREGRVKVKLVELAGLEPTGEEWSE